MATRYPGRAQFLQQPTLKFELLDVSKRLMHRTRYILQLRTSSDKFTFKKVFDQFKTLGDNVTICMTQLIKKYGLTTLELSSNSIIRRNKSEEIQKFIRNLNFILSSNQYSMLKADIRAMVFAFVIQEVDDDKEEETRDTRQVSITTSTPTKDRDSETDKPSSSTMLQNKVNVVDEAKIRQLPVKQCWVHRNGSWHHYKPIVRDQTLILQGVKSHYFYMKGCQIELKQVPFYHIEFKHRLDKSPVLIRVDPIDDTSKDAGRYEPYVLFFSILKQLCKNDKVRIDVQIVGKLCIELFNLLVPLKQNDKDKQNSEQYFIRVTHEQATFSTLVFSPLHSLGISLHLPLLNPYGFIKFELIRKVKNWLHRNHVDQLISHDQLEVQEVYKMITAGDHNQLLFSLCNPSKESEVPIIPITINFTNESNLLSFFITNDRDKSEGQELQKQYDKDEMRVSINRCKRIAFTTSLFMDNLKEQLQFKHPVRGVLLYIILVLLVLFFDFNKIPQYFLTILLITAIWLNPTVRQVLWQLILYFNVRRAYEQTMIVFNTLNPKYVHPLVISIKEAERAKLLRDFEMKMKKQRSLYGKYKRLMEVLFMIQCIIGDSAQQIEKLKNLLNWTHPIKTYYFIIFGSVALLVLTYFPLRLLMVFMIVRTFFKNKNFYPQVYIRNRAVVYEMFKITVQQNPKQLQDFQIHLTYTKRSIEQSKNYYPVLQKKLPEVIKNLLGLDVQQDMIRENNSVDDIVNRLATYGKKLRINASYRRTYGLYDIHPQFFSDGSTMSRYRRYLWSYLYNIPSDRYLMENTIPKLKKHY